MMQTTNHSVSGTRAAALTRCAHQCVTPDLELPRPRALASGVRILIMNLPVTLPSGQQGPDPRNTGQGDCGSDGDVAGGPGRFQFQADAKVPSQVTNAVAQVVKQRQRPAEQQDETNPGADDAIGDREGVGPGGGTTQPDR